MGIGLFVLLISMSLCEAFDCCERTQLLSQRFLWSVSNELHDT